MADVRKGVFERKKEKQARSRPSILHHLQPSYFTMSFPVCTSLYSWQGSEKPYRQAGTQNRYGENIPIHQEELQLSPSLQVRSLASCENSMMFHIQTGN